MPEPEDLFDVYINGVQVSAGVWDIVLDLYLNTPTKDAQDVRRVGRVRMSPQHGLILAKMLQRQMDFYQETLGPISLPDQLYADLGLQEVPDGDD